ncbi:MULTISPECIES: MFS transporter [unclassified Paenibacillus]|uniref:MFS transporter n=1 Tax=unclassified Paenibacillus TaxID=185978 RepID=UPI00363DB663
MEPDRKKQYLLLTAVALGMILNPLNTSMISVAFSRLQEEFQVQFMDISWLIATFYLASAIGQPVMGKLSDLFGRKRIFLIGLALVTVSSLLAPLAPTFHWLMAFRVVQAIGTSAIFPAGMGIIRSSITHNQARAMGILSVFSSTSAAVGPSIGGLLIHYGDWPAIFLINFPVIVVSLLLAVRIIPADVGSTTGAGKIDLCGIALFSLTLFLWLLFLLDLSNGLDGWKLGTSIILTLVFYWYETRQAQPFVDIHFLKNNLNVTYIYMQFIFVNIIFYSVTFGIPIYLQDVRRFTVQETGLMMLSLAMFGILITPFVARWLDNSGPKYPLLIGNLIFIIGTVLLSNIQDDSSAAFTFTILSILGAAVGMLNLSLQTGLYTFVSKEETGIASGLFMTSRFIGTILSSSLLGIVFGKKVATGQLNWMGVSCVVISLLMLMISLRIIQTKELPHSG